MKEIFKLSLDDDGLPVIECEDLKLFESAIVHYIGTKMTENDFTDVQSLLNVVTLLCLLDNKQNFHDAFLSNLEKMLQFMKADGIKPPKTKKNPKGSKKVMS